VQRFTRGPTLAITVAEDSASLHIESEPEDLDLLLFEIIPADTPVRFHIESSGDAAPPYANVGDSANVPLGDTFTLRPSDAIGLPGDFEAARRTKAAGVHLWWLSGEEMAQQGRTTELTPEEIKRLKALGYIQ
jgi:hypothetical protein